jgi:hypothetical protein
MRRYKENLRSITLQCLPFIKVREGLIYKFNKFRLAEELCRLKDLK